MVLALKLGCGINFENDLTLNRKILVAEFTVHLSFNPNMFETIAVRLDLHVFYSTLPHNDNRKFLNASKPISNTVTINISLYINEHSLGLLVSTTNEAYKALLFVAC